ncbi:hypothetical protein [Marinobacterium litorale]|uniref:hypothetical protein n=1 Tax=Marinobacterium litorale TaxID=404770 RepID=UPI000487576C|nr:hypothetical protein [Marinobacterium litorale]
MKKQKKRTKKYSPLKSWDAEIRLSMRDVVVLFITGQSACTLVDYKTRQLIEVSEFKYSAIAKMKHNWSIYLAAFGYSPFTKENIMKGDLIVTDSKYYQHELTDYLNDKHDEINKRINPNHFIGSGWFASPRGKDFSEHDAYEFFKAFGAFNRYRDPETGLVYETDIPGHPPSNAALSSGQPLPDTGNSSDRSVA